MDEAGEAVNVTVERGYGISTLTTMAIGMTF